MSRDILPEHPAELTLLDYLVGHLPPDVSDQIRRHVSSCKACRGTIAELSLTVDELDRLPTVPIPHDAIADSRRRRQRRGTRLIRILPAVVLVGAAASVLATFRLGSENAQQPPPGTRVHVPAAGPDTPAVLDRLLENIPHRVVQDANAPGHWIVQVGTPNVSSAVSALASHAASPEDGPVETVDVGGFDGPAVDGYDG
jgi:anti-sigma factor RsiW